MNEEALGEASCGTATVVFGPDMIMDDEGPSQKSVLFASVAGSAKLHEKLGDTEALRATERCVKRIERAVEAFKGRILKQNSNELMAVFEMADEAYSAAVEMQQRVADLPPVSGVKLAIRVGFSHGAMPEEEGSLSGEAVDMATHLAGLAKPGQVLTSLPAQNALSRALQLSTRDLGSVHAKGGFPGMRLFELTASDLSEPALEIENSTAPVTKPDVSQTPRLRLRYGEELLVLDKRTHVISIGRDVNCDVVIRDRRASRHHVLLELREGNKFVLSDKSTNGTFVTLEGQPEIVLRKEECVIHGKGIICFAASANSPEADCVEFEQF